MNRRLRENRICSTCGKEFITIRENNKYCSRSCFDVSKKGRIPWNKPIIPFSVKCVICNKVFYPRGKIRKHNAKFCSIKCKSIYQKDKPVPKRRTGKYIKCIYCHNNFYSQKSRLYRAKFCSKKCYDIFIKGKNMREKSQNWNGGKYIDDRGYIQIYCENHPFGKKSESGVAYVYEHRLVMEKFLGRYLEPQERVHHINEIKSDNRIENLMYFPNEREHQKFHQKILHS